MIDLVDASKFCLQFIASQKRDHWVIGASLSLLTLSIAVVSKKAFFKKVEPVDETVKFKARLLETYKCHNPFFERSQLETLLSLGRLAGGVLPHESHFTSNFHHLTTLLTAPSPLATIPSRMAALTLSLMELKSIPENMPQVLAVKKESALMSAKETKEIVIALLAMNVIPIYSFVFTQLQDESLRRVQDVPHLMKLLKGILEYWTFRDRFSTILEEYCRVPDFLKEINRIIQELEPQSNSEEVISVSSQVRESVSASIPPSVEPQLVPLLQTTLTVDAIFSHTLAVALPEFSDVFHQFLLNIAACRNEQERKAAIEDYKKLTQTMLDARITFASTMCKARQECVQTNHEMLVQHQQNVLSLMSTVKQIEGPPEHASV